MSHLCQERDVELDALDEERLVVRVGWREVPLPWDNAQSHESFDLDVVLQLSYCLHRLVKIDGGETEDSIRVGASNPATSAFEEIICPGRLQAERQICEMPASSIGAITSSGDRVSLVILGSE